MTTQEILEAARGAKAALALADGASRAQALRSMAAQLCSPANMTASAGSTHRSLPMRSIQRPNTTETTEAMMSTPPSTIA